MSDNNDGLSNVGEGSSDESNRRSSETLRDSQRTDRADDSVACSVPLNNTNLLKVEHSYSAESGAGGSDSVADSDVKTAESSEADDSVASSVPLDNTNLPNVEHSYSAESGAGCSDSSCDSDFKTAESCETATDLSGEIESSFTDSSNSKSSDLPPDSAYIFEDFSEGNGHGEFVNIEYVVFTSKQHVVGLMQQLCAVHYEAGVETNIWNNEIHPHCKALMLKDYKCELVDNFGGIHCRNYPVRLIIPVEKMSGDKSAIEFDVDAYRKNVKEVSEARCRGRFVVPVILFDNKFICRSATLANKRAAAYETVTKADEPESQPVDTNLVDAALRVTSGIVKTVRSKTAAAVTAAANVANPDYIPKIRHKDQEILEVCRVKWICDLMVDERKAYKGVFNVCSSEKVSTHPYDDFRIEQMPYPGCEFFARYHNNQRVPEGMVFNWNRKDVDVELSLSEPPKMAFPEDWENYKEWDIIKLTKNYMKVLLFNLVKDSSGLLLHCISGWDRTPLFISLLRASLWADGVIHESLKMEDMAYLMMAYDWYMFGHNLPARLKAKEEILHFCLNFLAYLVDDEFSVTRMFSTLTPEQQANREFPKFKPGRRKRLQKLSSFLLSIYDETIAPLMVEPEASPPKQFHWTEKPLW